MVPKVVDAEARRREVVDALFRVAVRDGLQRASLRAVADEVGLNIGSVRHYFASQQELMTFAMRSMLDRLAERLLRRVDDLGDPGSRPAAEERAAAAELLGELLPLDNRRRAEVTVFLDFITAARTNPALADLSWEAAKGARSLVRRILNRLTSGGAVRAGLDIEAEVVRLTALVDGLGLHSVLHPEQVDGASAARALRDHLESLAPDPGPAAHRLP